MLEPDARKIMDDYVTLRLLLLLSGAGLTAMGAMLGFLWGEIALNRELINEFPTQIEQAVSENSTFQVQQRIRLWDRAEEISQQVLILDRDQARLTGRIEGLIKSLDRVIVKLDDVE